MKKTGTLLVAAFLSALLVTPARGDGAYKKILQEKSPCIATVKMVLKVTMNFPMGGRRGGEGRGTGQAREETVEIPAVILHPGGIVAVSTDALPGGGDTGGMVKASVTEAKVLFGGGDREYEAVVVVKDSNLHLTYLAVKGLGDRTLPALDLDHTAAPEIGTELVGVTRLGERFAYAPFFGRALVTGKVERPRPCFCITGDFHGTGLPLFDRTGALAGFVTVQRAGGGEGAATETGRRRSRRGLPFSFMRGGPAQAPLFLVPAQAVKAALPAVLERAKTVLSGGMDEGEGEGD